MQPEQTEESKFPKGTRVRYLPHNAFGDPNHMLCENGRVIQHGKHTENILVAFDGQVNPQWCHENSLIDEPVTT